MAAKMAIKRQCLQISAGYIHLAKTNLSTNILNNVQISQAEGAKYLGIHLDRKLAWQQHIFLPELAPKPQF